MSDDASPPVTIYSTAPRTTAKSLARRLVEERLVACVNIVDCDSVYRWEGDVVTDDEAILLAKTTDDRSDEVVDHLVEWHPYDVPCVERFPVDDAHAPFSAWCADAVGPAGDGPD